MTSSLRVAPLQDTLSRAKAVASGLGITRVTDTTWLDCIGIPVFASIRPGAMTGSLCVNAGKGVHADEARVGAYMEAIEYALAEYRTSHIDVYARTPRLLAAQPGLEFEFVDLCPLLGEPIDVDGPLACVEAEDIGTGRSYDVPAELVFLPYPENAGQQLFGTSSNGLCSGNTVDEATMHGLAEVVERDVQAFNFVRNESRFVELDEPCEDVAGLLRKIFDAGLIGVLRYTGNRYGLPFFEGFILEQSDDVPIAISQGSGLHLDRDIAAVRAIAEAAQSRLSNIHGGRDDLIKRVQHFAQFDTALRIAATKRLRDRISDTQNSIDYTRIPTQNYEIDSIEAALNRLVEILARQGVRQVLRVVLSPPGSSLAVVKVIVPKLESFDLISKRVGPRLLNHFEATRRQP